MALDENQDNSDPTKPESGAKPEKSAQKSDKKEKIKKITEKDFKKAETILKTEYAKRKTSQFRQKHERIWNVVDKQVTLEGPDVDENGEGEEWLNVFELGILAQASEIMTSDLMRVVFPGAREWFDVHIDMPTTLDENTGDQMPVDKKMQSMADGRLRAMMAQQHMDFGLKDRVELSAKEAFHHGAFVAEVAEECMDMYFTGAMVKEISSPVWKPHSMWNCYPDPSPSLVGSSMFYNGSMFIKSYMPRHKFLESAQGEGWIKGALKKIPKEEHQVQEQQTKDLEIVTYWGDVIIPASGDGMVHSNDDMVFPNYKAVLANGKLVYLNEIKTPYLPIIYKGYERMDVRDPYAISPIIKQSPAQTIVSILANEFVNSVQLNARPPIVYDGNDPDFVVNGGPVISPGAKTSSKGSSNYKEMKIGDPKVALDGVQFMQNSMKESLGRPGIEVGSRATKAEVDTKQADSEAGLFGFAAKMDDALRTFLYMQHAMNLAKKDFKFTYYNPEMDSPDFLRVTRKDLPETVHFEVVGTKGILGENKRHQAFLGTVSWAAQHPLFAPELETQEILKQLFMDSGTKGPERFMKQSDGIPAQVKQQIQQMQQMMQKLQGELNEEKSQSAIKEKKMGLDHEAKMGKLEVQQQQHLADHQAEVAKLSLSAKQAQETLETERQKMEDDKQLTAAKLLSEHQQHAKEMEHKAKLMNDTTQLVADKSIAKITSMIKEFEHKIEMLIALEQKEQETALSNGEKAKESKLTDNLLSMHAEVMKSLEQVTKTITAPKRVKRDADGRMIGVELDVPDEGTMGATSEPEAPVAEPTPDTTGGDSGDSV